LISTFCPNGGYWNRVPVNKVFIEQPTSEPKAKAFIPMYQPLEVVKFTIAQIKHGKFYAFFPQFEIEVLLPKKHLFRLFCFP